MSSAKEIALDLLRRLLAGEQGEVGLHLAMLLEASSPLDHGDEHYRQILPPELVGLRLTPETRDEIVVRLCAEASRNPRADLISAASWTRAELGTKTVAEILLNPLRPLTMGEYGVALSVMNRCLPGELSEDWEFLPKADVDRLAQLARELQNVDEKLFDPAVGAAGALIRHHAEGLIDGLTRLGFGGGRWPRPPGAVNQPAAGLGERGQDQKSPDRGEPAPTGRARETATDLLRRLLAGERGDVPSHLAALLEKSSPRDRGDEFYRETPLPGTPDTRLPAILPAGLDDLRLSAETRDEIIATLCAKVSRNPDEDLMWIASSTGSELATKTIAKILANPPRPLTMDERIGAFEVVNRYLPYCLSENPGFLPKADLDRLVQLAKELRNVEKTGTDEADSVGRIMLRHNSAVLLNQLRRLGIREQ